MQRAKQKQIAEMQFFFSSRRRHTRLTCDWSSECALPILSSCSTMSACTISRRVLQLLRLIVHADIVEQLDNVAVEDFVYAVRREIDAVIGDAVLREVVRP